jgi:hypothetical protein
VLQAQIDRMRGLGKPPPAYRCAPCEDTGWVYDEEAKGVRRCTKSIHSPPEQERRPEKGAVIS